MSDYLWDKTGEVDPEIERLEELVGEMRYRPREFKLPPEVAARTSAAPNVRSFNPRRAYPIAAALLLALFAGVWFVTQRHSGEANEASVTLRPQAAPSQGLTPEGDGRDNNPASSSGDDSRPPQLAKEENVNETIRQTNQTSLPAERHVKLAKRERRGVLKVQDELAATNTSNKSHSAQIIPASFSADEQRQAKAQLMYALRLTSSTLNEVRRKVQETNEKPSFEERRKTR